MKYLYSATEQRELNDHSIGHISGEFYVITAAEMYRSGRKRLLCLTLKSDRNREERPFYIAKNPLITSFLREGAVEDPSELLERRVLIFCRKVEDTPLPYVENFVMYSP